MKEDDLTIIPELKVTDFNKSLKFYTDICGFSILYSRPENEFAMLGLKGSRLMIESLSDKSRAWKVGSLEIPFGRGMHFQIQVDNVQNLYEKFIKINYPLFLDMEDKWYRVDEKEVGNRQFLIQDPDGYLLRFYENLGIR